MIFSEIRADHTVDGLKIEFRPKPIWEPYVEAVLARLRQEQTTSLAVTTSERKTGLYPPMLKQSRLVRDERGVAPAGRLRRAKIAGRTASDGVVVVLSASPTVTAAVIGQLRRACKSGCRLLASHDSRLALSKIVLMKADFAAA